MGSEIVVHQPQTAAVVRADDFMPLMTVDQAVQRKEMMNEFINKVLKEGDDYGPMPGDNRKDKKKVLLKPGAEKLCSIFGLAPRYVKETIIEDWTGREHGGEPLFYYEYRCQLYRGDRFMGEGIGSCNTWEAKYRYRWINEDQLKQLDLTDEAVGRLQRRGGKQTLFEPFFAFDKRETTGKYGKPEEHWQRFDAAVRNETARKVTKQTKAGKDLSGWEIEFDTTLYRIPNPDVADLVNTCQKIGQKRAQVAAVLVVTNCSDAFTQDLDDASFEETEPQRNTPAEQKDLADKRVAEEKEKTTNGTPAPLKPFLAKIDENPANFKGVCEHFYELMSEKGAEGAKAYQRIADKFWERFPTGTGDKAALKAFVNDLYVAFSQLTPTSTDGLFPNVPAHDTVTK